MLNRIKINLWVVLVLLTAFGLVAMNAVFGLLREFDFNGQVDANAIAVALVAVISLILGYVLGTKQSVAQTLLNPEPDPPPAPTVTEDTVIEMLQIMSCKDCTDEACKDKCKMRV